MQEVCRRARKCAGVRESAQEAREMRQIEENVRKEGAPTGESAQEAREMRQIEENVRGTSCRWTHEVHRVGGDMRDIV